MSFELTPYPTYKPSCIDWLGNVPSHWDIFLGRASYEEKPQRKNVGLQETTVLSLSYGEIVIKPPESLHGLVPESFETYQIVEPLDIIVRPTDLQNDWNSLRFGLSPQTGIITSGTHSPILEKGIALARVEKNKIPKDGRIPLVSGRY